MRRGRPVTKTTIKQAAATTPVMTSTRKAYLDTSELVLVPPPDMKSTHPAATNSVTLTVAGRAPRLLPAKIPVCRKPCR